MLTIRVEPFEGTLEENKKEAIRLAMRLNCTIVFTFEGKDVICNGLTPG
jgi:hypothetical protein